MTRGRLGGTLACRFRNSEDASKPAGAVSRIAKIQLNQMFTEGKREWVRYFFAFSQTKVPRDRPFCLAFRPAHRLHLTLTALLSPPEKTSALSPSKAGLLTVGPPNVR